MTTATCESPEDMDALQREAYEWITRFFAGGMSAHDIAAMKAWIGRSQAHSQAYAQARKVWNALGPVASARMNTADETVFRRTPGRPVIGRRALIGGAIAASTAYAIAQPPLGLWPSYAELTADYRTGAGEFRSLQVTEAISVDLNTRTSISVQSTSAQGAEFALVAGEAAFSTGPGDNQVSVSAGSGRVIARQAFFNLRCEAENVWVACLDGTLTIERDGGATVLRPHQQIHYSDHAIGSITPVEPATVSAWREGLLIFEGTPVSNVIAEINRYRAGRIFLMNDGIGRRRLTARLRTSETDRIVAQIVEIFGVHARTLPGGIVILS